MLRIPEVNGMDGARKITSHKCAVYGSGLSQSALLVLAKQHNEFNQIQCTTNFPETATCCWRLLFFHFAQDTGWWWRHYAWHTSLQHKCIPGVQAGMLAIFGQHSSGMWILVHVDVLDGSLYSRFYGRWFSHDAITKRYQKKCKTAAKLECNHTVASVVILIF